jgi:DNA-binding MarR family transcriptional regulator
MEKLMNQKYLIEKISKNFIFVPLFLKHYLKPPQSLFSYADISGSDMEVLFFLDDNGEISMTELSNALHISKPNLTKIANKLFKLKYVVRKYNEKDRRTIFLNLTKTGKKLMEEFRVKIEASIIVRMEQCSPQQLELISEILEKIKIVLEDEMDFFPFNNKQ